ncbi:hypothetical protein FJI16_20465 [Salmonella enterica]|nr:hypothetical protein [Salmonella enterica subsp. enterica serovar Kentucky]EBL4775134.1 hypothetical protein [Salmonella enterica subsp. enterica serovar Kentucky]
MSFNAKDMTQGGQIASMRIRMFSQIANIMLYCLFIFFWILVGRKRAARTVLTGMCYSVGSATRQGSSSPTRFIGQSAMTSRT